MVKGTLFLMLGQVTFLIAGYTINILLALRLGPQGYGLFSIAMAILVWVELFVVNGVPTAMQRFIAGGKYNRDALANLGIKWQLLYCGVLWALFIAATPLISTMLVDKSLMTLLWIASIDIIIYGMYWLYTGILGGDQCFFAQALSIMAYALGKLTAVMVLVFLNWSIIGALIGNWIGSAIGLAIAAHFVKRIKISAKTEIPHSVIRQFITATVLYTIMLNLLLYLDIFFVKRFLSDVYVGYYNAAGTIARIPYFIFLALSFTLLPVLSRSIAAGAEKETRKRIMQIMRYLVILLIPIIVFVWHNAEAVLRLFYSTKYLTAAPVLPILTLALSLFTIFSIMTTILNADGRPGMSLRISAFVALVDASCNVVLVPRYGMVGAALATGIAGFLGVVIGSYYVYRRFASFARAVTLLRVTVAAASALFLVASWQVTSVDVIPKAFVFSAIYFAILILSREVGSEDWSMLRGLYSGKQKNAVGVLENLELRKGLN